MKRLLDWRFLTCLIVLTCVTYLVFAGAEQAHDNRAKGERIDVLVTEIQRQHDAASSEREAASSERAALLAGQRDLQRQYASLINRQTALLTYLRRHGIEVPARFSVAGNPATTGSSPAPTTTAPHRRTTAPAPAPATVGKSGKVPPGKAGHRRGRR